MAAAAVVSAASSVPYAVVSAPSVTSVARKRRRDNNPVGGDDVAPGAPKLSKVAVAAPSCLAPTLLGPRPIVTVRHADGAKRPQMKYDPSVPMTKEETSAWRREQRRKRNRESAAACRRRQRDRISELEEEARGWKARFEDALRDLEAAEGEEAAGELRQMLERTLPVVSSSAAATSTGEDRCSTPPPQQVPEVATSGMSGVAQRGLAADPSRVVSPSHSHAACYSYVPGLIVPTVVTSSATAAEAHTAPQVQDLRYKDLRFPFLEDPIHVNVNPITQLKADRQGAFIADSDSMNSRVENRRRQHLNEKITRPAVKITGAANDVDPPLDTIESVCDDLLQVVPDSCLSLTEKKTMPFPETCPSLVVAAEMDATASLMTMTVNVPTAPPNAKANREDAAGVSTDESDENSDLGEFLLDAVQWL